MNKLISVFVLILLFQGCTEHNAQSTRLYNPEPPENTTAATVQELQGPELAAELQRRYQDTRTDCGSARRPAFLCSGILLRGTSHSEDKPYDAWDPSDTAIRVGGTSFSYIRSDFNMKRLAFDYDKGYIFFPYMETPPDKLKIEILCFFPVDGQSDHRTNKGCGPHKDAPSVSEPCGLQNINTAEQWRDHYVRYPQGTKRCGFDVSKSSTVPTAAVFHQALLTGPLVFPIAFEVPNDTKLETWLPGSADKLPIQAFMYTKDTGISSVQHDQRRFHELTGIALPIIRITLPNSFQELATFEYRDVDQAVLPEIPDKTEPKVPKTYNAAGDHLKMSDIYTDSHVDVEVPHYAGMHATDTISVHWQGRVNYNSPIIEVGDPPGKKLIPIPRLEVIDNIGRSVEVGYSVKEKGIGEAIESDKLTLHIDPQAVHPLPAPSYSASKVTVDYGGQTGYTVRARWVGVTTRDTETQDVTTGQANVFDIPSAWITENQGKTVLINYSVVRTGSSEQRMFSQVLRVNIDREDL
ncbi:hypothetical protein LOY70_22215 [Pseudomonas sp. B21-054]|uniref:hypothetical protein n=1 Tax=Pseudomonas sp. B21-054 TaxID=2895494 RepID=UPI00223063F7|nr:hypothetical protein [Pseudomonas sp. B21-054]UZE16584.1 hypothetical protein LOY70_22215 [Pseudomonas sp. B21-054]